MRIFDVLSALNATDEEIWQYLGNYWGLNILHGYVKCYGIFTESKKEELAGYISHITLNGKTITLPFGEPFSDGIGVWENPKSVRFGYITFRLKLIRIDKRRESGHPFLFTVDPYYLQNVYPEMDPVSKEAELKRIWGVSNNLASGT